MILIGCFLTHTTDNDFVILLFVFGILPETACSDEKLDAVCDQYADCKALTYELTHAFISAVYIYDLDNIEIVWKFKDFLTTSKGGSK